MPLQDISLTARERSPISSPLLTRAGAAATDVHASCLSLTARQREVLALLMQGKSNKAICRVLDLAEPTVKNHITAIFRALNVTNRTEAVIKVSKTAVASLSIAYTISGYHAFGRS